MEHPANSYIRAKSYSFSIVPNMLLASEDIKQKQNKLLAESRRDQEEGGELDCHEEVRRFCGSRRDQEKEGSAGLS